MNKKFEGKEFTFYSNHRNKKSAYEMISKLEENGLSFLYRVTKSKGLYTLWIRKVTPKVYAKKEKDYLMVDLESPSDEEEQDPRRLTALEMYYKKDREDD